MIRFILIVIFLVFFVLFSLIALPVEFLVGKVNPRAKQASSQRIVVMAFRVILFLAGAKVTVKGRENIPEGPVLFVSNHRSYFDILLGYTTTPYLTGYVAKIEFARIPFLKQWMDNLKCLFLDRDNAREGLKTILTGIEQIKEGMSIFIAPEGTRNHEKELLPFKPGSLKMAEKTGCPIVPVAVTNTDEIFELHMPWIKSARVSIEYGKPIYISELDAAKKKALLVDVKDEIESMLAE